MPKLRMIADLRPIEEMTCREQFLFIDNNTTSAKNSAGEDVLVSTVPSTAQPIEGGWWFGCEGIPRSTESVKKLYTHFVPVSEIRFEEVE